MSQKFELNIRSEISSANCFFGRIESRIYRIRGCSLNLLEHVAIVTLDPPHFAPESVILGFEIAENSAIEELFPSTELRGCFFHWKQCLICKFKAVKGYPRDLTVLENLHCLFGLAFVPEPDVPGCWDVLKQILWGKSTDFRPVLRYMETEWINNTTFPEQTWNVYNSTLDNDPRTNNYSEGNNNALNQKFACTHPFLLRLLQSLEYFNSNAKQSILRIITGQLSGPRRNNKIL